MTKKLYLEDPYLLSCTSEVVGRTRIDGKQGIILDRTVFYPTSGGQPHDTGRINDVPVVDVFEDENKQIVHLLEKQVNASEVETIIDWERRFDHMQQHTGQHILSQAFVKSCNADTLSFHMGEKSATIDLNRSGLTLENINKVERLANRIIYENREVIGHMVGKNELNQFPVRGVTNVEEDIRILEIRDYDYSPCGGTHCSRTGEIGIIKISRCENYKSGKRVHFVCGSRALKDFQEKAGILRILSQALSCARSDLPQNITKLKDDLKALMRERNDLNKRSLNYEADSLFSQAKQQAGIFLIKKIFKDRHQKDIKLLANKIMEKSDNTIILFGIKAEGKAQLLFQCSEGLAFDMGKLMKTACAVINGIGGGRPRQAQGGGPDGEKLADAIQNAEDAILEMITSA
jgi:alanyl-tRNA synthetase